MVIQAYLTPNVTSLTLVIKTIDYSNIYKNEFEFFLGSSHRRPSLERQTTLYDDQYYDSRDYPTQPYSEYEEVGYENNTYETNQQYRYISFQEIMLLST